MAQEIPTGYSGVWQTSELIGYGTHYNVLFNETMPGVNGTHVSNDIWGLDTRNMNEVEHLYYADRPIPRMVTGCDDECEVTIQAPALAITDCTSHAVPVNYTDSMGLLKGQPSVTAGPLDRQAFLVANVLVAPPGEDETIQLFTGYSTTTECAGTYNYTSCSLHSAIGEYNISIKANLSTIDTSTPPRIIAFANNTHANMTIDPRFQAYPSTLGGLVGALTGAWRCSMTTYKERGAQQWLTSNKPLYMRYAQNTNGECPSFNDPLPDMLAELNKLMVYTGAIAGHEQIEDLQPRMDPGVAARTRTTAIGHKVGKLNVFQTDYWWFFGAALVEVICICFVAPAYWGWWRLGRSVSFSPLEIAKAFEAPMLAACDSNSTGRDAAKAMGDVRVDYGFSIDAAGLETTKLAFLYSGPFEQSQKDRHASSEIHGSPV
ncbi:uncharacterized protein LTR77_000228 [Saxophila tyrrhenica]|uniref:Uncharacterized protein n=1 Tax=Saxophila tyrrhenica TaxID=1690608 RepID=A0AAV9PM73_9PEZI|nr:hypothetical protein LTR77_000228 [Saxophila tyrrhenica]